MKKTYIIPVTDLHHISLEELLQVPGASQVDNDGDGQADTYPVIIGDPEGGIGAKQNNIWDDWDSAEEN